jgi:hypothetical protein
MPRKEGPGQKIQGSGTVIGMGRSSSRDMAAGGFGLGLGHCVCPACGERIPHHARVPCFQQKCPKCGTFMTWGGTHNRRRKRFDEFL